MATKKRSTIKSRKESISARKPKTLSSILKGQTKLSKSFKESLGIGAAIAGPGKFLKPIKKVAKVVKKLKAPVKRGPDVRNPKVVAKAKAARPTSPADKGIAAARRDVALAKKARKQLKPANPNPSKKTIEKRVRALKLKRSRKAKVTREPKVPKDSRGRDVEGNFQEIEGRRVFVPDK
jgi:hypothetical protein